MGSASQLVPRGRSITHEHLLRVVVAELRFSRVPETLPIRILDVGCGDGELISYLHTALPAVTGRTIELFGLDVADHGVQAEGFFAGTVSMLESRHSSVPWRDRLILKHDLEPWALPVEMDVVLSNQVVEHVRDPRWFFRQVAQTLAPHGFATHLFPLREVWWEGHLHLPFAHKFRSWNSTCRWIYVASRAGLGKWGKSGQSLEEFAAGHADYLFCYTNYQSTRQILEASRFAGLRASFAYSGAFFLQKLFRLLGVERGPIAKQGWLRDSLPLFLWKRVSSVTLLQRKANSYRRFE